jgi:hypothetical protein
MKKKMLARDAGRLTKETALLFFLLSFPQIAL